MNKDEVFLDNDKLIYKDKEHFYLYSDIDDKDKSKELLINDNDKFSQHTTMNRNMTVIRNKLNNKYDYSHVFGLKDLPLDGATAGFVLMTDGEGTTPYWADPIDVAWGLLDTEIVSQGESFSITSGTFSWDLFKGYNTNYTIPESGLIGEIYDDTNSRVNIVDGDINLNPYTRLELNPFTISRTGKHRVEATILPTQLQLVNGYAGTIFVKDTIITDKLTYVARTDRGDVILENVTVLADGINTSQIYTDTVFNTIFSIYMFDFEIGSNIYTLDEGESARNYRELHLNSIVFDGQYIALDYASHECDGSLLEFYINTKLGCSVSNINIELYLNEVTE
jgi:hypothetical protein